MLNANLRSMLSTASTANSRLSHLHTGVHFHAAGLDFWPLFWSKSFIASVTLSPFPPLRSSSILTCSICVLFPTTFYSLSSFESIHGFHLYRSSWMESMKTTACVTERGRPFWIVKNCLFRSGLTCDWRVRGWRYRTQRQHKRWESCWQRLGTHAKYGCSSIDWGRIILNKRKCFAAQTIKIAPM